MLMADKKKKTNTTSFLSVDVFFYWSKEFNGEYSGVGKIISIA